MKIINSLPIFYVLFNYGGGGTHPLVLLDVVIFIIGLSYSRQESSFLKNLEKIPMAALGALGQLKGIEMI